MKKFNYSIKDFVFKRNSEKILFTAGPASISEANIYGLRPCFGRGDIDYENLEKKVLDKLKDISGHSQIVRMQGSASLALEIMIINFLYGKVLLIDTGYYSQRLYSIINSSLIKINHNVKDFEVLVEDVEKVEGKFDWIVSCYTETVVDLIAYQASSETSEKLSAKLMLDATASIGLEENHKIADVIAYSSCKGLFGLTGAAFIAFNEPPRNIVDSFYLILIIT